MSVVQSIFYAAIIAVPLLLGLLLPISGILAGRYVRYFVYPYLAILILFTSTTYGVIDNEISGTIYGRGTGKTFFGFVNIYLYWLGCVVLFDYLWNRREPPIAAMRHFLFLFSILFIAHIPVGLYLDKPFFLIIDRVGVLNIFNMTVLVYVMLRAFRGQKAVNELIWLFMLAVLVRCLFGLVRFLFLGGDPANYYANMQQIGVKLTFFDINDSMLACMAAFLAAWRLIDRNMDIGVYKKLFYWVVMIAGLLVILLSFRRTAWLGLAASGLVFIYWHRRRLNFFKLVPFVASALVAMLIFWTERFQIGSSGSLLASLFPDIADRGGVSFQSGRFFELSLAIDAILKNPIFGVGSWGEYSSSQRAEVAFHGGQFFYMHSGFLHVWLKTGLIGLVLFAGAMLASVYAAIKSQPILQSPELRSVAGIGLIGLVMSMPNMLFGTPIIEYRTMQLLGFALVLPYLAYNALTPNKATL